MMMEHLMHLLHYDALLHWCALIALGLFVIGMVWVRVRILIPLRRLVHMASLIAEGEMPAFDQPVGGIREIEQVRAALHGLSVRVRSAQAQEVALRRRLSESREEERRRIARNIHDDAIQLLVVAGHGIDRAAAALNLQPEQVAHHLEQARARLTETVDVLRRMIGALRPGLLDDLGLEAALRELCARGQSVYLTISGQPETIPPAYELAIYRAAQEAMHNAQRHARASCIQLCLRWSCTGVILEVQDDGIGFCVPAHLYELAQGGHFGLLGIREQITALGGMLAVDSAPGRGTRVNAWLPTFTPPGGFSFLPG